MSSRRPIAILAALALIPVVPYAILGYAGQDLPFHVASWLEISSGWRTGHLLPGWSATANFSLGDPHLTFYPPVSFFIGALLTLLFPLRVAPAVFCYLALFLSGVSMHAVASSFLAKKDRLLAAALYMLGPYLVVTSLVRYAAAELVVQAILPFIALYLFQILWPPVARNSKTRPILILGLLLALTWLTDIPAAIVLLYGLLPVGFVACWRQRSLRPILNLFLADTLATALAAFYLLPVWSEQRWINTGILIHNDPRQILLFMPQSGLPPTLRDSPLVLACWLFLIVECLVFFAFFRSKPSLSPAAITWTTLAATSILLQLPVAYPIWSFLPQLSFVQFPFRFLPLLGVALPLLLFATDESPELRPANQKHTPRRAALAIFSLALLPFLAYLSMQGVTANRTAPLPALIADWQSRGVPEYIPAGAIRSIAQPNLPSVSILDQQTDQLSPLACRIDPQQQLPNLRIFTTACPHPFQARVLTYFYPYWRAFDENHHLIPIKPATIGLMLLDIPGGQHTIELSFHPRSTLRIITAILSILTLLATMISLLFFNARRT